VSFLLHFLASALKPEICAYGWGKKQYLHDIIDDVEGAVCVADTLPAMPKVICPDEQSNNGNHIHQDGKPYPYSNEPSQDFIHVGKYCMGVESAPPVSQIFAERLPSSVAA